MANLATRIINRVLPTPSEERAVVSAMQMTGTGVETFKLTDYRTFADQGYRTHSLLFALIGVRIDAFSEARFIWRNRASKELFGTATLAPLETPWPNGTTGDLLSIMELDVSLAGNAYIRLTTPGVQRLRPDLVDLMIATRQDGTEQHIGYAYWPNGRQTGDAPILLAPAEVAHYWDRPSPWSAFMGESWISAVAREVDADATMTVHKNKFHTNAATPNLAILTQTTLTQEQRDILRDMIQTRYTGAENAFRTIVLEGGADIRPLGHSMEQLQFTDVQAAGETRIAAASGVPPVVVGFLQGIQAATYSNYSQAMRRYADLTVRPKWRRAAAALETIVTRPGGAELWYDDRDIPFLQQDAKDAAEIKQIEASTLETLIRAGYTPESALAAVNTGRYDGLTHTGLVSVQLQPPGQDKGSSAESVVDNDESE